MPARVLRLILGSCFFLTGAVGLIYQLVWSRFLTLSFGAAPYSIATVVAAYMLGLGLGSWRLGRLADRVRRPALLYAVLEVAVGLYAIASPLVLGGVERLYVAFHRAVKPDLATATAVKLVLTLAALTVPTVLMGGTLPVLMRALARGDGSLAGSDFAWLYALNTLGAFTGTILAGFVLIERLGLQRSLLLGAFVNLAVGALIFALRPQAGPVGAVSAVPPVPVVPPVPAAPPLPPVPAVPSAPRVRDRTPPAPLAVRRIQRFALAAAFVCGFAALADELVWTRVVSLVVGSSTYAFAIILASFLLGIGGGSLYHARRSPEDPARRVVRAQLGAAAGALLVLVLLEPGSRMILYFAQDPLATWWQLLLTRSLVVAVAVIPAAFGFGLTLPALVTLATRDPAVVGTEVGLLYAANTLGSILGAALGGFVLLRYWSSFAVLRAGIVASLAVAAGATLAGAAAGSPALPAARRTAATLALAGCALAVLLLPPWPRHLLDLGAFLYGRREIATWNGLANFVAMGFDQILFLREGPVSTVSVRDSGYGRYLRINGKTDASNTGDMGTELALALVPAFYHEAPRRALVIGAGSGVTTRALAAVPGVESIDLVEIEPAVIAAGSYFEPVNHGIYGDRRVRLRYDDGRNHLLTTRATYDLIISEPSNPWMAGVANLFTLEFYALARARLADGGVFCQWLQRYGLTQPTTERLLATVTASFEHVEMWRATHADSLLVATRHPVVLDRSRIQAVLRAVRAPSPRSVPGGTSAVDEIESSLGIEDEDDIASLFVLGDAAVRELAGGALPFRNDPPELEFRALRDLDSNPAWQQLTSSRIVALKEAHRDATPAMRPSYAHDERAYAFGRFLLAWGDPASATPLFEQAGASGPRARYRRWLGIARAAMGDGRGAERAWTESLAIDPEDVRARVKLASARLGAGDRDAARRLLPAAAPGNAGIERAVIAARLALVDGRPADAIPPLVEAALHLGQMPDPPGFFGNLSGLLEEADRALESPEEVARALDRLRAAEPHLVEWTLLASKIAERRGRFDLALGEVEEIERRRIVVADAVARKARCLAALGRRGEALEAYWRLVEIEPWSTAAAELEERLGVPPDR